MSELADIGNAVLEHAGVKFRSGRFPYGSGERPHQHDDPWRFSDGDQETDFKAVKKDIDVAGKGLSFLNDTANSINRSISNTPAPKKDYRPQAQLMTDEELRNAINRMNMEKQYSQMMNEMNPQRRGRSIETVAKVIGTAVPILAGSKMAYDLIKDIIDQKATAQENQRLKKEKKEILELFKSDPDYWFDSCNSVKDIYKVLGNQNDFIKRYEKSKDYIK